MASLSQKFRTGFLTLMHGLADKVISLDSPGAVKQHIRDLEEGVKEIRKAEAGSLADVTLAKQDAARLDSLMKEADRKIERLDTDGDESNDYHIPTLEAQLLEFEQQLAAKQTELTALMTTSDAIKRASSKLQEQLVKMRRQMTTLESDARAAAAKNKAADAMEAAAEALSSTDATASVDNLNKKIKRDNAVADERLKQVLGTVAGDSADDAVAASEVAERIAARRARRAAAQGVPAAPTSGMVSHNPPMPVVVKSSEPV